MENVMDAQKKDLKNLFELINQNPELPIIPMVNYEIVADDSSMYWMASWGKARVDSYYIEDDRIWYLSDDRDEIFNHLFEMPVGLSEEQEKMYVENAISSLPWIKAIMVKIELPV